MHSLVASTSGHDASPKVAYHLGHTLSVPTGGPVFPLFSSLLGDVATALYTGTSGYGAPNVVYFSKGYPGGYVSFTIARLITVALFPSVSSVQSAEEGKWQ